MTAVDYETVPHFVNSRGQHIFCNYWEPTKGDPKALLFIVHGLAEYCELYGIVADSLTTHGVKVCSHDHVGHGKSEGPRAYITDFRDYIDDVLQHVELLREKHPNLPIFIFGYSMGGNVCIQTVLRKQEYFSGMILVGPMIDPSPDTAVPVKVFMAKALASVWPRCPVGKLNSDWMCRDKELIKVYNEDPMIYHGKMKAGWAVAALNAMSDIQDRLSEFSLPMLLVHGDADSICQISGTRKLYEQASSTDKIFSSYDGCYHKVFRETEGQGEKCIEEITNFITSRIPS